MSVAKIIELTADGKSIEDAVQNAVSTANKSVRNITGVYVQDIKGMVADGAVTSFRVNCKVTFIVGD